MPYKDPAARAAACRRYAASRPPRKGDRHRNRSRSDAPFVGVDGEGGDDGNGTHVYYLLRAGKRLLFTGSPLTTRECLAFLADLPPAPTYVAFAFDYDVTMMMRGVPLAVLKSLADRESRRYETSRGTWEYRPVKWAGFEFDYIPRRNFKVRRQVAPGPRVKQNEYRSISDTFGHFQCSFVKALTDWNIGDAETRERIAADKARRSTFGIPDEREIAYNAEECALLAVMMEQVREACRDAGIVPKKWEGAGRLAGAMLETMGAPRSEDVRKATPEDVWTAARKAYYGGRFEVTRFGHGKDMHEYDLASAYPAAMTDLPCLLCGKWTHHKSASPRSLHLAYVTWGTRKGQYPNLGPFPIRRKDGRIIFPMQGRGWYWSVEVEAARAMGFRVTVREAWKYTPAKCEHKSFGWIADKYAERVKLGKSGRGMVLKFALNSLYGKMAQTRPELGPYANWIYAGLITAKTRAAVATICLEHNGDCIRMLATDGVYCEHEIPGLDETPKRLGAWEHEEFTEGFFAIMPGMYRKGTKLKTRGIPESAVKPKLDELVSKWDNDEDPFVVVSRVQLQGLRLCVHRNKPELMGQWPVVEKTLRMQWAPKRDVRDMAQNEDGSLSSYPPFGSPDLESVEHTGNLEADVERLINAMEWEGAPGGETSEDRFDALEEV